MKTIEYLWRNVFGLSERGKVNINSKAERVDKVVAGCCHDDTNVKELRDGIQEASQITRLKERKNSIELKMSDIKKTTKYDINPCTYISGTPCDKVLGYSFKGLAILSLYSIATYPFAGEDASLPYSGAIVGAVAVTCDKMLSKPSSYIVDCRPVLLPCCSGRKARLNSLQMEHNIVTADLVCSGVTKQKDVVSIVQGCIDEPSQKTSIAKMVI